MWSSRHIRCSLIALLLGAGPLSAAESRWKLDDDAGIRWDVRAGEAHQDQIEMSGRKVSLILT